MVARGRPRVMHSGGPPHRRQGVEKGGASAGRTTIGYRVAVRSRLANRVRGERGLTHRERVGTRRTHGTCVSSCVGVTMYSRACKNYSRLDCNLTF